MSRRRGTVEHAEFAAFCRRIFRAYARRMADLADPEDLADLVALRAELDAAITAGGRALHASGRSYTELAAALGVSRQSARERFMPR